MGEPRTYRSLVRTRLTAYTVTVKETDLHVQTEGDLSAAARELVLEERGYLEAYIREQPGFVPALTPWSVRGPAPEIVREMAEAGAAAGVGPMAAVAGAIAGRVGRGLLGRSHEVIVENGGDVFLRTAGPATVAVFAGRSALSLRVGVRVDGGGEPIAVCTSSGSVGHSLSFGRADAACVVARSCALADAAATALGNRIRTADDLTAAIAFGRTIPGVLGLLAVIGERMAAWGELEIVKVGGGGG
jgi:ApbE superfamily uncharacterized protein (UPF0280 family)